MKTKVTSLLVVFIITATSCMAQQRIIVEAQSNDISNNLDLRAVASIFGDSKDLEEFELRLNDYDSQISNLDLNNDGEVDYLRVIESSENNVHLVVIQAVLDRDIFQDVATIVIEKNRYNRTVVHVIGDPYMYGENYIIEPVYYRSPSIFSYFLRSHYRNWYSPYYWGYYPREYRYRRPFSVNIYLSTIHTRINNRYDYRYRDYRHNEHSSKLYNSIRRNDYGNRYPDRNFSNRNKQYKSKRDFDTNRSNSRINESEYRRGSIDSRNEISRDRKPNNTVPDRVYDSKRQGFPSNNSGSRSVNRDNDRNNSQGNSSSNESNRRNSESSKNSQNVRRPLDNSNSRINESSRKLENRKENSEIKIERNSTRETPKVRTKPDSKKAESSESKSNRRNNTNSTNSERR